MLAQHFARLGAVVRYATSPGMANYLRLVGGAHGLSPFHPALNRTDRPQLLNEMLRAAMGGDHEALGMALDYIQDTHGRQVLTPDRLAQHSRRNFGNLHDILSGLHQQSLGTDFHPHPYNVESVFHPHLLGQIADLSEYAQDRHSLRGAHANLQGEQLHWLGRDLAHMGEQTAHPRMNQLGNYLMGHLQQLRATGDIHQLPGVLSGAHEAQSILPASHGIHEQAQRVAENTQTGLEHILRMIDRMHGR